MRYSYPECPECRHEMIDANEGYCRLRFGPRAYECVNPECTRNPNRKEEPMSRTIKGKLTGRAAATEKRELREELNADAERRASQARTALLLDEECGLIVKCIEIEGAPTFWNWYSDNPAIPERGSTTDRIEIVRTHLVAITPDESAALNAQIAADWDIIPEVEF